jgi:hypothetical protein
MQLSEREKEFVVQHEKGNPETIKRYDKIVQLVSGDDIGSNLLEMLVIKASEYVKIICRNDVMINTQKNRLDGDEFREFMKDLDSRRKIAHDALISSLHALNRYCLKEYVEECPIGGIYSLSPESIRDRVAVGDWAGSLVYELFIRREK